MALKHSICMSRTMWSRRRRRRHCVVLSHSTSTSTSTSPLSLLRHKLAFFPKRRQSRLDKPKRRFANPGQYQFFKLAIFKIGPNSFPNNNYSLVALLKLTTRKSQEFQVNEFLRGFQLAILAKQVQASSFGSKRLPYRSSIKPIVVSQS